MLGISRVTVNCLDNPAGITGMPQFGWVIASDRTNVKQTAYQLQIATDAGFTGIVGDSGVVVCSQSTHIRVDLPGLSSSTKYYVRVKIKDEVEESPWSETARFTTALLENALWRGRFVTAETEADAVNSKGTLVRRDFSVRPGLASAMMHCTALGLYQLYLNGRKVGDDELTPGWTSYRKHLLYQTYDVTDLLQAGGNAIGAMLGAGWYKGVMGFNHMRNHYGDRTAFLCQLELVYGDGSKETVVTDESWVSADSPILFSEIYDGETYDARLEQKGWNQTGFDASGWKPVMQVEYDYSVLSPQSGCKVKEMERIPAQRIFTTPRGDTVIDFGQNLTGWVQFKVKGKPGDCVILNYFEVLDAEGNAYFANLRGAKSTDTYYLKGGEEEVFHPRFSYHGFQYVKLAKYPGEIKPENFMAIAVYSDMKLTGTFECSNPDLNQLHHNILWSMKGNFLDVPTDCPQRDERLGWTGDAQIFSSTACYLMDTYTFYSKWLKDLAADQTEEGGVPHLVPDIITGKDGSDWLVSNGTHSAAAWADSALIIPWNLYLAYGDTEILARQYDSMKAWVDFMQRHSDGPTWSYRLQFGDWVALDAKEGSYFGATPEDFVCAVYYAISTGILAKTAAILNKQDDFQRYSSLFTGIVDGFQKEFFTPAGRLAIRTQTAHILALYFDLVPPEYRQRTIQTLLKLLEENNGHLVTGFLGTPYFCHALSSNNHSKEAYELLLKDDFPSWLYQVKAGATTVWEHWDGKKPDGTMWSADMNSFNHYAYGAIGEWLYRAVAGIAPDESNPGFKRIRIRPTIGGNLQTVKAGYRSINGDINVCWMLEGDVVTLDITIPHNTTAEVLLDHARQAVSEQDVKLTYENGLYLASIGSGSYRFRYIFLG